MCNCDISLLHAFHWFSMSSSKKWLLAPEHFRSPIWRHLKISSDSKFVKCDYCNKTFQRIQSGTTTNLTGHLLKLHRDVKGVEEIVEYRRMRRCRAEILLKRVSDKNILVRSFPGNFRGFVCFCYFYFQVATFHRHPANK